MGSQSDGTVHHGSEDMAAGVRFLVTLDPQAGSSSKDWWSGMPDNGWRLLYSGQVETYTQTGEREREREHPELYLLCDSKLSQVFS